MAYSVQKENSNVITVIYTGSVNLQERKMAVEEVCELFNPSDSVRLLIDVKKITMDMSRDEQICFAEYLVGKKELANAKVAVLHNPRSNPNLIINAVASTEGYGVVAFDNNSDAILWLTGDIK